MNKQNVLFVCIHNSARSQMAAALLNKMCGEEYEAHSAGLTPGTLNPLAVEVMREVGVDISGHTPQSVFDVLKSGQQFATVVTVCDESSAERCPVFPGAAARLHWSFPDPAAAQGSWDEKLAFTRRVRGQIETAIMDWCPDC